MGVKLVFLLGADRLNRVVKLLLCACFLVIFLSQAACAEDLPLLITAIDREESERLFLQAYDSYTKNKIWSCVEELDQALKLNTYFIDTYYLKSLALRRIGRYPDAMTAMRSYLEVRRSDLRGQMILGIMEDEWQSIKKKLYPTDIATKLFFSALTFNKFLKVPVYAPISFVGMKGLGKLSSAGQSIFVCDTLGDVLYLFDAAHGREMLQMNIKAPVAVLPVTQSEALLFQKSGDIHRVKIDFGASSITSKFEGSVDANVSDSALIDSSLVAVADRTGQAVRFYGLPSFNSVADWRPADRDTSEKLFEPVALSVYGPLLAVADRGNSRVFVLDTYTLSVKDQFDIESPRDVEWGSQGELYVLTERGELYSRYPIGAKADGVNLEVAGMRDAWSVTWTNSGPVVSSVSGRVWWDSQLNPGDEETCGSMSLHEPWIKKENKSNMLFLKGAVPPIFSDFLQGRVPDVHAVWRNEVRPARVIETVSGNRGEAVFYSSSPMPNSSVSVRQAASLKEVMADIIKTSRAGGSMPGVIVLDTRISFADGEQVLFFSFLQKQGIRLDLWAIERPASTVVTHISRITQGNTYFSKAPEIVPANSSTEWVIGVPLPPDITTFGYPSEATLSIFATEDRIRFNDWMPIWPSLIKKK